MKTEAMKLNSTEKRIIKNLKTQMLLNLGLSIYQIQSVYFENDYDCSMASKTMARLKRLRLVTFFEPNRVWAYTA